MAEHVVPNSSSIDELKAERTTIVVFAVCAVVAVLAWQGASSFVPEARRAPQVVAMVLAVLATFGTTSKAWGLVRSRSRADLTHGLPGIRDMTGPVTVSVLLITVYVYMLGRIGFLAASIAVLVALPTVLRPLSEFVRNVVYGLSVGVLIWVLFAQILGFRLPRASWF